MSYHVLELYECLDLEFWQHYFTTSEVIPELSRHGPNLGTVCVTWASDDVHLSGIYHRCRDMIRMRETQTTLYTDVIEPPYRMQPDLLDHGKVVEQWRRGRLYNPQRWPDGELLPDYVRNAVVRLEMTGTIEGLPKVTLDDGGGACFAVEVDSRWRTRRQDEYIVDALESAGTTDFPVSVRLIESSCIRPFFPWVKQPMDDRP
ncbi:hypothetical protein [Deinococcus hohokamensis]|uniref:Uncharacterized protein n=1 Tax=Deinococcus hohokamensis TaxID=309883 RepID=A0ABV9I461_9DEIO